MGVASGARERADTHKVKLVAVGLALSIAVGYLLGGRLSQLSDLKPRSAPLALIGLLLQLVNPPGSWPSMRRRERSPRLAPLPEVPGVQV